MMDMVKVISRAAAYEPHCWLRWWQNKLFQEYILDKADTERRARQTTEHGFTTTSTAALTHKNERGLMKNTESKTLLKSSSKVSK